MLRLKYFRRKVQNTVSRMSDKKDKKSSGHTTGCLIFVIILLLLSLLGLGAAFYLHIREERHAAAEEKAFACLEESASSEDFKDFLRRYPLSSHCAEVVKRMEYIQLMENVWKETEKNGKSEDYRKFSQRFPNPYYDKLSESRIDSLDWLKAKISDNPDSYEEYMISHPDGSYFTEASLARRQSLGQLPSVDQLLDVRSAIEKFLGAVAKGDGSSVGNMVTSVVEQFLGQRGISASDVAHTVRDMLSSHIKNCSFSISDDFEVKRLGAGKGYSAHATVEQSIKRDNAGKTSANYILDVTLDDNFKISSFAMKEIARKDK